MNNSVFVVQEEESLVSNCSSRDKGRHELWHDAGSHDFQRVRCISARIGSWTWLLSFLL